MKRLPDVAFQKCEIKNLNGVPIPFSWINSFFFFYFITAIMEKKLNK